MSEESPLLQGNRQRRPEDDSLLLIGEETWLSGGRMSVV